MWFFFIQYFFFQFLFWSIFLGTFRFGFCAKVYLFFVYLLYEFPRNFLHIYHLVILHSMWQDVFLLYMEFSQFLILKKILTTEFTLINSWAFQVIFFLWFFGGNSFLWGKFGWWRSSYLESCWRWIKSKIESNRIESNPNE